MAHSTVSVFTDQLFSLKSIALGRLVLNVRTPWQDFCPSSVALTDNDISKEPFLNIKDILSHSTGSKFHSRLTHLLSGYSQRHDASHSTINAPQATKYSILNSSVLFETMCGDENIRLWFEKCIKSGSDIFMVVGMITVTDAVIGIEEASTSLLGGGVQVPVTDAVTMGHAVALPAAVGEILDVSADAARLVKDQVKTSFVAPGERVIGIQYRKVRFEWLSSRLMEKAFLEKNSRWKIHFGADRGDESEGDDDIIEACLDFDLKESDIREDDGSEATAVVGGELVFIS
jgi:hypothetical protein